MSHLFSSLRFRLILLVLLALLPALGLILYSGLEQQQEAAAEAQKAALRLVRHSALDQERLIQGATQLLAAVAQLPTIRERNQPAVSEFLQHLLEQNPSYANIGIISADGQLLSSALPLRTPVNYADTPWFAKAMEKRQLVIGEYQIDRISGKANVPLVYPVFDQAGQLEVMVYASLDLNWLSNLAAKIELPPSATLAIIDRQGTFLVRHPNPEKWVGQIIPEMERVNQVLAKEEGTMEAMGIDGNVRLYAFSPLKGMPEGLFMRVGLLKKEVFAKANQVMTRNLIALGLVVVLSLSAAWLFGSLLIMRGINTLVATTERLATGDLSVRTGWGPGAGEIHQLALAFDEMVAALEQREYQRQQAEAQLRLTNEELIKKQACLEEDLKAAACIQASLLPQRCPDDKRLGLAWRFMPCNKIGGDIFNILHLDENHWAVYMVDVSGHGVPAAMVSVSISQFLAKHNNVIVAPSEVMIMLDQEYPLERFDKYFTVSYLLINVKNGEVRYSSAGHPAPILLRRDGALELLEEGGTIIGMDQIIPFEEGKRQLYSGDKLFLFTDGILEYENQQGQFYGENRFHQELQKLAGQPVSQIIDGLMQAFMAFGENTHPRDDISILGLEFFGKI